MVIHLWFSQNALNILTGWETISFSRSTQLHGVSRTLDENEHSGFDIKF
jgi:hypothetical protein